MARPLRFAKWALRNGSALAPRFLLDPLLARVVALLLRRHPGVFERMDAHDGRCLRIVPDELGLAFELTVERRSPRLSTASRDSNSEADAEIRGSLPALIALLEGRIDGDALFFSRELTISGDTELVLALRNSVDAARIDLIEDLSSLLGPAAGPAEIVMRRAAAIGAGIGRLVARAA
jgi:predicted lipid carrier protein YhbT